MPHASVAVAVPNALLISAAVGLHPRLRFVPPTTADGGVRSLVHVTVLDAVDVLPHASFAVKVLVCVRTHPLLVTLPSLRVNVGPLQASLAVAVPNAALMSLAKGLHPMSAGVKSLMNTGGVTSAVHVAVLVVDDMFSHPSFA